MFEAMNEEIARRVSKKLQQLCPAVDLPDQISLSNMHEVLSIARAFERNYSKSMLEARKDVMENELDEIRLAFGLVRSEHGGWKYEGLCSSNSSIEFSYAVCDA